MPRSTDSGSRAALEHRSVVQKREQKSLEGQVKLRLVDSQIFLHTATTTCAAKKATQPSGAQLAEGEANKDYLAELWPQFEAVESALL